MIFTSRMVHLTAVVLREAAPEVSKTMLGLGVVQFNRLADVSPALGDQLREATVEESGNTLAETRQRIETMLNVGGLGPPHASGMDVDSGPVQTQEINSRLDRLARDVDQFRKRQAELQQEINRISDVQRQLKAAGDAGVSGGVARQLADSGRHRFVDIRFGTVVSGEVEPLDRELGRLSGLVVNTRSEVSPAPVIVVSMKRNSDEVERILSEHGFRKGEAPTRTDDAGEDALDQANKRLESLRAEQKEQGNRISAVVGNQRDQLERDWHQIRVAELLLSIRGQTSESQYAAVFSGWVPVRQKDRVEGSLREVTDGACVIEWHSADEINEQGGPAAPVELRNPRFLKPFQMLVTNYGVPAYGTIDPTPLVAISYLLMFGLMFGDAGHGLVLVVLGMIGTRVFRTSGLQQLSRLLMWCGGASIVMGVLFGAYFGFSIIPALWFDYHRVVAGHAAGGAVANLMDILALTVYLGIGVIGAGLVLNWVNRARAGDWRALVFDKAGVLGGVMYGTGVWIAIAFARSGFSELPRLGAAGFLIGIPAVLLFLKFPLEAAAARKEGREQSGSAAMWVMDWIIELLEVFSGYLANTLSFMRVAGLGIAHVMLMVAFYQIATMISPGGLSVWSLLVLIAGNALVITLEGLSAGIQSLRLNYYEFFSKYFTPTGTEYRPVSLESNEKGA